MVQTLQLDDATIDAIAQRVASLLREHPAKLVATDPWLTRLEAAEYLRLSPSTFDRMRAQHEELKPVQESPVRWSQSALDAFKLSRGVTLRRPARRPRTPATTA